MGGSIWQDGPAPVCRTGPEWHEVRFRLPPTRFKEEKMEVTCWHLDEQGFVDYRPWMRWCPYIIIFVNGVWYHQERIM